MAKAVLISIRPGWVEMILDGEKALELRKTRPKVEPPFKCYIYCTLGRGNAFGEAFGGLVVGEFVCDRIESVWGSGYLKMPESAFAGSCLNMYQIDTYLDGKDGYFWHISNLEIYDTPKELTEFYTWKKCKSCSKSGYESTACIYDENCMVPVAITKAPQSWCYVEELR